MPSDVRPDDLADQFNVRRFEARDQPIVSKLFTDGLLAGQIAPNDTGADVENIGQAYFSDEQSNFWVAEVQGEVQGMIGVASEPDHIAEIRRLRVARPYQPTAIAATLVETALQHCQKYGYLKVVFDTRVDPRFGPSSVVDLFDRFGFQHTRTKQVAGKELLEFYLDIYRQPKSEHNEQV